MTYRCPFLSRWLVFVWRVLHYPWRQWWLIRSLWLTKTLPSSLRTSPRFEFKHYFWINPNILTLHSLQSRRRGGSCEQVDIFQNVLIHVLDLFICRFLGSSNRMPARTQGAIAPLMFLKNNQINLSLWACPLLLASFLGSDSLPDFGLVDLTKGKFSSFYQIWPVCELFHSETAWTLNDCAVCSLPHGYKNGMHQTRSSQAPWDYPQTKITQDQKSRRLKITQHNFQNFKAVEGAFEVEYVSFFLVS